jgi:hypothetical protein
MVCDRAKYVNPRLSRPSQANAGMMRWYLAVPVDLHSNLAVIVGITETATITQRHHESWSEFNHHQPTAHDRPPADPPPDSATSRYYHLNACKDVDIRACGEFYYSARHDIFDDSREKSLDLELRRAWNRILIARFYRSLSMARDISLVAWPLLWPSSSSTARRLSL